MTTGQFPKPRAQSSGSWKTLGLSREVGKARASEERFEREKFAAHASATRRAAGPPKMAIPKTRKRRRG